MSAIDQDLAALEADGKSIEDLANEGINEDGAGQQYLDFGDKLDLKVGGMKPSGSEIKIRAISRPIKGQLGDKADDEIVTLLITCVMDPAAFAVKRDGNHKTVDKTRRHTATPLSVHLVSAEQAAQILGL